MIIKLFIVIFLYAAVFLVTEFFYKRGCRPLLTRKIGHLAGAFVSLILPYWFNVTFAIGIAVFFSSFLWWTKKNKTMKGLNASNGETHGAALFPLGIMLSFIFFAQQHLAIYNTSILILALADGLAGFYGYLYGKKKFSITGQKTYLGSGLFFLSTLLILLALIYYIFGFISFLAICLAMISAMIITLVEASLGKGWDNLAIPLASGVVIYYLFKILVFL
jgi:phytol kinase